MLSAAWHDACGAALIASELADVVDLEPKLAGVADEVEPVDLGLAVAPLVALGARRRRRRPICS